MSCRHRGGRHDAQRDGSSWPSRCVGCLDQDQSRCRSRRAEALTVGSDEDPDLRGPRMLATLVNDSRSTASTSAMIASSAITSSAPRVAPLDGRAAAERVGRQPQGRCHQAEATILLGARRSWLRICEIVSSSSSTVREALVNGLVVDGRGNTLQAEASGRTVAESRGRAGRAQCGPDPRGHRVAAGRLGRR